MKWFLSHLGWPIFLVLLFLSLSTACIFAQDTAVSWIESFDLADGIQDDAGQTAWIAIEAEVQDNKLVFENVNGFWISEPIRLYNQEVEIDILFGSKGSADENDQLWFSYEIDGKDHRAKACGAFPDGKMSFTAQGQYLTLQIEAQTKATYYLSEIKIQGKATHIPLPVEIEDPIDSILPTPQPPGPIVNSLPWEENFDLPDATKKDSGTTAWRAEQGEVRGQQFEFSHSIAMWESYEIDTENKKFVIETIFGSKGNVKANDLLRISYIIDGKTHVSEKRGPLAEGMEQFKSKGSLLQIKVEAITSGSYYLKSVRVRPKKHAPVPDSAQDTLETKEEDVAPIVTQLPDQLLLWQANFSQEGIDYATSNGAWMSSSGLTHNSAFIFQGKGLWKSAPIDINGQVQIDLQLSHQATALPNDLLRIIYQVDGKRDTSILRGSFQQKFESQIITGNRLIITIESYSDLAQYQINGLEVSSEIVNTSQPACMEPRKRLRNIKENGKWRIVSDIGTNLRGIGGWWHGVNEDTNGKEDPEMYYEEAWWKAMWENGLNVSRNIVHDPWRRARYGPGNGYEMGQEDDRNEFFKKMDQIVALSAKYNMYVVINYHEVGKVDMDMCREFWSAVAPRYKDYTHISFELMNEPNGARDWTDKDSRNVEEMYRFVRRLAPDTHLLLCSFSNMGPDWLRDNSRSMLAAARSLRGIDWSNAGIAFHSYWGENAAHYVEELIAEFPAINTEINLPIGYRTGDSYDDHIRNKPLALGEEWNQETMERLNVGWMTWEHDTWREYRHNYLGSPHENLTNPGKPGLLYQARQEGWVWDFDKDLYNCNDLITHQSSLPEVEVFPNPVLKSFSSFNVQLPDHWLGAQLNMVNVNGDILFSEKVQNKLLKLLKPARGVYSLIVQFEDQTLSKKFLVE